MKRKKKQSGAGRAVVGGVLMSVLFMWLMPYGTFDPSESGFYVCIGVASFISLSVWYLLKRYRTDNTRQ